MSLLQLHSISARYENSSKDVLSNISLEIEKGDVVAILGPNGAGKTTLLNIIGGLFAPSSGHITFNGEVLADPSDKLIPGYEDIKVVYQNYGLKPGMTVYENIRYQLLDYRESYQKERIEYLLNLCQLEELSQRKPARLSGGQQQKVALANAMATDPQVLLMDEPFANVDPAAKEELFEEIRRVSKVTETTIILVTHDAADALALSDKVIFLSEGVLQQYIDTKTCYYKPATLQVASFLGPIVRIPPELMISMKIARKENKQAYIRPEKIGLTTGSGFQMKVIDKKWRGFFHLYTLQNENGSTLSWYSSTDRYKKGDFLEISLSKKDVMWF